MFQYASNFNGDISNWNASSVQQMQGMFDSATNFNSDLSSWDVSSVVYLIQYLEMLQF